jgi:hypothetical protein
MARPKGSNSKVKPEANTAPVTIPADLEIRLSLWWEAQAALAHWKEKELALRNAIVLQAFNAAKLEGVERVALPGGFQLECNKVQSYTANNADHATEKLLAAIGPVRPDLAIGLVKWTPDLSKTAYRELLEKAAELQEAIGQAFMYSDSSAPIPNLIELMAAAISIKPGQPQLSVVAPKAAE